MSSAVLRLALLLGLALLVPARGALAAPDYVLIEKQIAEEKAKAAKVWLELARDLGAKDLKSEARDAVRRAREVFPDAPGIAETEVKVEALEGAGVPDAAAMRRIEKAREDVARAYERMAKVLEKERQDARHSAALVTALRLSPSKTRQATLGALAMQAPLLVQADGHPCAGWLSLPKGWKPGAPCGLLVVFEGEALQFKAGVLSYAAHRQDAPWAILAPLTFSSGVDLIFPRYFPAYDQRLITEWNTKRSTFDADGLPGLLEFVRAQFTSNGTAVLAAQGRGANPALVLLARRPGEFARVSLAHANFDPVELPPPAAPANTVFPEVDLLGKVAAPAEPLAALAERGLALVTSRDAEGATADVVARQQWAWLTAPR